MRRSKFTDEQIGYCLTQTEAGAPIEGLWRKYGISQQRLYRWRSHIEEVSLPAS